MMRRARTMGAAVIAAWAATMGTAVAAPPKPVVWAQPTSVVDVSGKAAAAAAADLTGAAMPKGYVVVAAGPFDLPGQSQRRGQAHCPGQKVPLGGGAFITTSALLGGVNSAFPSGKNWIVDANNGAFSPTTFSVYVICAKKPGGYKVVKSPSTTVIAYANGLQSAVCPAGRVPLGGGALTGTLNTAVNFEGSFPGNGTTALKPDGGTVPNNSWTVWLGNYGAPDTSYQVYAVCGLAPRGYFTARGGYTTNPSNRQTGTQMSCAAPAVPISGGSQPGTFNTSISVNTSYPAGGRVWKVWQNNIGSDSAVVSAWVVCAAG